MIRTPTTYAAAVRLALGEGVRWLRVEDGLVLLVPRTERYVDLDQAAGHLWAQLEASGWDVESGVAWLASQHDISRDRARECVAGFVDELVALGVLVERNGHDPAA